MGTAEPSRHSWAQLDRPTCPAVSPPSPLPPEPGLGRLPGRTWCPVEARYTPQWPGPFFSRERGWADPVTPCSLSGTGAQPRAGKHLGWGWGRWCLRTGSRVCHGWVQPLAQASREPPSQTLPAAGLLPDSTARGLPRRGSSDDRASPWGPVMPPSTPRD